MSYSHSPSAAAQSFYDFLSTQRAVRRLRPDPIPDEVLARVMDAARYAPSGGNRQGWRFVMVTDADKKKRLGELYAPVWEEFRKGYEDVSRLSAEAGAALLRTLDSGSHMGRHMHGYPLIAIVCFNPKYLAVTDAGQDRLSVVGGASIYPAVQNFMLACRVEGLGCVLTTLLCRYETEVKSLLSIPDDWYTAAAIPVGYPMGGGYGPVNRMPVEKLFFHNTWGVNG